MQDTHHTDDRRTVSKNLDDADRTDGFASGHASREEVMALCHAQEGQDHD